MQHMFNICYKCKDLASTSYFSAVPLLLMHLVRHWMVFFTP